MAELGQGVVLMIAGMAIVYAFLYILIIVSNHASRFVSRFDYLIPDDKPKKVRKAAPVANAATPAAVPSDGTPVKAPVPGTVLRLTASNGQSVNQGDEILVMDVMKMETPVAAPCDGTVTVMVGATDKVATGDTLAVIG